MEAATTEAELSGLDPAALYSFSVTPHNALGDGKPSVARMSRSLADITGITGPAAADPVAQDTEPGTTPPPRLPNQHPLQHPPGPAPTQAEHQDDLRLPGRL